jgi:hypothetical protein
MPVRTKMFVSLLICLFVTLAFAADKSSYQSGKIVSIEKRASSGSNSQGGTDAQLAANSAKYDVVINTGGHDYKCLYSTSGDLDPTWAVGKEGQVRVKGKVIYVKRVTGEDARCTIEGKSPASK